MGKSIPCLAPIWGRLEGRRSDVAGVGRVGDFVAELQISTTAAHAAAESPNRLVQKNQIVPGLYGIPMDPKLEHFFFEKKKVKPLISRQFCDRDLLGRVKK